MTKTKCPIKSQFINFKFGDEDWTEKSYIKNKIVRFKMPTKQKSKEAKISVILFLMPILSLGILEFILYVNSETVAAVQSFFDVFGILKPISNIET